MRIGVGIGLGLSDGTRVDFSPASLAIFAAFTTPPTEARKALIDSTVKRLQLGGVWARLTKLVMLAAANEQASLVDWKNPSLAFTKSGTPTFTADRGFTGDGVSGYLDSGVSWATLVAQDDASLWVRVLSEAAATSGCIGTTKGGGEANIIARNVNDFTVRAHSAVTIVDSLGSSRAFFGWSRLGAAGFDAYRAKTRTALVAVSVTPPVENMTILRAGAGISSYQIAFGAAGASLTIAQQAVLHDAVEAYLSAVGAV